MLDSLNPVTIAVHVYLLGTPEPKTRTITFMGGIFLAYLAGGLLLSLGLGSILDLMNGLSASTWNALQAAAGLALLGFAWYLRSGKTTKEEQVHPASMSAGSSFWLGFAVTVSDLPTAVPYIAAIERTLQARPTMTAFVGAMVFYNMVYIAPLLVLFGMYLALGKDGATKLQKMNVLVRRWSSPVPLFFCVAAGILLLGDSVATTLGHSIF